MRARNLCEWGDGSVDGSALSSADSGKLGCFDKGRKHWSRSAVCDWCSFHKHKKLSPVPESAIYFYFMIQWVRRQSWLLLAAIGLFMHAPLAKGKVLVEHERAPVSSPQRRRLSCRWSNWNHKMTCQKEYQPTAKAPQPRQHASANFTNRPQPSPGAPGPNPVAVVFVGQFLRHATMKKSIFDVFGVPGLQYDA